MHDWPGPSKGENTMYESNKVMEPPAAMKVVQLNESIWQAWQIRNAESDRRSAAARLVAVKCASIALLIITATLWEYIGSYHVAIRFALALGALVVAGQALRSRRFGFAFTFLAIAAAYNPFVAVFPMTGGWPLPLIFLTVVAFTASLFWLRDKPGATGATWRETPNGKTDVSSWENEGGASEGLKRELVTQDSKGERQ
jgi:hypothetical protein